MNGILKIASLQLQNVLKEPLVIVIALILIALSVINGAASARQVQETDKFLMDDSDHFFSIGVSNALYHTSILLSALSMFVGALTIAEEKANGSLNILSAKPVFKRDVFAGKYVGLSAFLLLLTMVIIMLVVSTLMIFYRGPYSAGELFLRMASYIIVIFLSCALTLGIAMFIGTALKGLTTILICTGTFLCIDWFFTLPGMLSVLRPLIPTSLFVTIMEGGRGKYLLNTAIEFSAWLDGALPYLLLIVIEIVLIFLVSSYIISRSES